MAETLEASCLTPRFVHGDCHAHQFFVEMSGGEPKVTGVVDMEVASAGDPIEDLLKFSLEVATILPARTRWWQALFDGYGQEPDYALFCLRMLGCSPEEFACVRPGSAERPWGDVVRHVLAADTWLDLFDDGW